MVPDLSGPNMKLNSFKTSEAPKFMIRLGSLKTTNHRKIGKSEYDRKLIEFDVRTT